MRPRIGITQRLLGTGSGTRSGTGSDARLGLHPAYAAAVEAAGAVPFLLPHTADAAALLEPLQGLLIPGGPDFLPDFVPGGPYRGVPFDALDPAQRAFDRSALAAADERDLPVLGVCYGMQLLALEAGGALYHHLPHDLPEAGRHTRPDADARHPLTIASGSRLAALLGSERAQVNSRHHQAVADPGEGLRVVAHADDGVIEALEGADGPFRLGVQWHPERMDRAHRDALFGGFVEACLATG